MTDNQLFQIVSYYYRKSSRDAQENSLYNAKFFKFIAKAVEDQFHNFDAVPFIENADKDKLSNILFALLSSCQNKYKDTPLEGIYDIFDQNGSIVSGILVMDFVYVLRKGISKIPETDIEYWVEQFFAMVHAIDYIHYKIRPDATRICLNTLYDTIIPSKHDLISKGFIEPTEGEQTQDSTASQAKSLNSDESEPKNKPKNEFLICDSTEIWIGLAPTKIMGELKERFCNAFARHCEPNDPLLIQYFFWADTDYKVTKDTKIIWKDARNLCAAYFHYAYDDRNLPKGSVSKIKDIFYYNKPNEGLKPMKVTNIDCERLYDDVETELNS